jgi:hypothetical protein
MKTILRGGLSLLLPAAILAQSAAAYDYPLSSEGIREAYFLGSGDRNKRIEYFEKYTKRYPVAKSGQYVASIFFETPYVLIAERASQSFSNYFAPDAVKDYLGKPAVCRVRAEIYFGIPTSPVARFRSDYAVRLKQHDKEIPIRAKWIEAMVSSDLAPASFDSAPVEAGMYLNAEYDADNIDPEAPATIEIVAPDGNNDIVETLDLVSLR